jgi:HK97 family phage prohead protease
MFEISGIAAPFYRPGEPGTEYRMESGEYERFAPGAFDRAMKSRRCIVCDTYHNAEIQLGNTEGGALRLWVDDVGLRYSLRVSNGDTARWLFDLIESRWLVGASVTFYDREVREFQSGNRRVREVLSADLAAVALTNRPAYPATTIAISGTDHFSLPTGGLLI